MKLTDLFKKEPLSVILSARDKEIAVKSAKIKQLESKIKSVDDTNVQLKAENEYYREQVAQKDLEITELKNGRSN